MQPGPFNSFLADTLAVDEKTVTVFTRLLKEADLLSSAGRGRYAPHMIPLDAARALIALMATDRPSESVAAVERWRAMKLCPEMCNGELRESLFAGDPTLEQVLVRIIAIDPDPEVWASLDFPAFEVSRNEKTAALEWSRKAPCRAAFRDPNCGPTSLEDRRELAGIRRSCMIAPNTFSLLATGLWSDRFRGCDLNGQPLDTLHPWNQRGTRAESAARRAAEIYAYIRERDGDWRKGAD